jgi:replication factor C large subunit
MAQTVAWAEKYRPTSASMLIGNEEAIVQFVDWLKQWTGKRRPAKTACLLVGPPGVGKTSLARAAARDLRFRILEMNASDVRTEKAIQGVLGPARESATLDGFSSDVRGNLILVDEVDGVFGREDRGGLGAILSIIEKSPVPIVLTANNVENERFVDLMKACFVVPLVEIRPRLLVSLMNHILSQEHKVLGAKTVGEIARTSRGDIRSAINDLQGAAAGQATETRSKRTHDISEKETLKRLFESGDLGRARRALDETEIPLYRDQLLLLLHDILPYAYTSPMGLAKAYDTLSRVDVGYGRIGASRSRGMMPPPFNLPRRGTVPDWSILPFVLNELATIGVQKVENDVEHVIQIAPRISQKIPERYQYRLWQMDRLCSRIARSLHISKRTALSDVVPFLVAVFRIDEEKGRRISLTLDLDEQEIAFLISESRAEQVPRGPGEMLNPSGFKLPYMGKDKFIQLMRAGLSYDRKAGKFVVRRLDDLDSVEERVSEIISKPVKFKRPEQVAVQAGDVQILKQCLIDSNTIACAKCEFVDDCPTHTLITLKFCLCEESLADPGSYEKCVAKKARISEPPPRPRKPPSRRKKS